MWVALPMALMLFPSGYLATPKALQRIPQVFAASIFCYFVGYQLYQLRSRLDQLFRASLLYLVVGVIASGLNQYAGNPSRTQSHWYQVSWAEAAELCSLDS